MLLPLLALLASATTPARAAEPEQAAPPRRIVAATVYGDDPCPRASADEIVVCARQPEAERYRIPKRFRDAPSTAAGARAWTSRMATVDEVNRAGMPGSCTPVGAGGQTGCTLEMLRRWQAERQARQSAQ